jgi:fumarylacetoacetase
MSLVEMHLPVSIGDYTDFYSSREHAFNVGVMFRGEAGALNPNWARMPIGYHGRASSVVLSGQGVRRPCGQVACEGAGLSEHRGTRSLDFELELGYLLGGTPNPLGQVCTTFPLSLFLSLLWFALQSLGAGLL